MTDLAIRERVAREWFGVGPEWVLADNNGTPCFYCGGDLKALPAYETDIAAAWLVEQKIAEMGLRNEYTYQLAMLVGYHGGGWDTCANLVFATPMQRCLAALATLEAR